MLSGKTISFIRLFKITIWQESRKVYLWTNCGLRRAINSKVDADDPNVKIKKYWGSPYIERYSESGKIQTRKTPNTETFHTVTVTLTILKLYSKTWKLIENNLGLVEHSLVARASVLWESRFEYFHKKIYIGVLYSIVTTLQPVNLTK